MKLKRINSIKNRPELQVRVTSHSRKEIKEKEGLKIFLKQLLNMIWKIKADPQTGKPLRLIGTNERKELVQS